MKTKQHSSFRILHSAFAILAAISLFSAAARAPAQTGLGLALSFDGLDDYVETRSAIPLHNQCFTLEAWAKRDRVATNEYFLGQGVTSNSYQGLCFGFRGDGHFTFAFRDDDLDSSAAYNETNWHHWAGTYDTNGGVRLLFQDGVLVASNTALANYVGTGPLRIGSGAAGLRPFAGKVDEVRIWNVARSQADITNHMFQPLTGTESGLVAYYRFDEGSGISAYDATTNHLNGTLANRPVRVPSYWSPTLDLHSPEFMILQLATPFDDPTTLTGLPLAIAAGNDYSLALRADGTVLGWGNNRDGQATGVPNFDSPYVSTGIVSLREATLSNVVAIAAGANGRISQALLADSRIVEWGATHEVWNILPPTAADVVATATGGAHGLALRADGTVLGWGNNRYGQATGVPNQVSPYLSTGVVSLAAATLSNVVAIAAGSYHSLALKADGSVVGWGHNVSGPTTIPPSATTWVVAIAAGSFYSLALKADGTVVGWGDNSEGQTTIPPGATTGVVAIAAGGYHSLALKADGTVVGWGRNADCQVSVPVNVYQLSLPLSVSGGVNTNVLGTYVLNYSTTNALGASAAATRTVIVATRPVVTTEAVTDVCTTAMTLNSTVNPRALETLAWFEYGLGGSYGSETARVPVGNSTNAAPLSSALSGLLPRLTYHYRTVASNALGETYGPDATFTLPGPSRVAPSLSALPNVTLPQGGSTSVWFTVSPPDLEVRVRADNAVLLPASRLVLDGSGNTRSLNLAPDASHSGSAQVTVTASDGSRAADRAFTLTVLPSAESHSPLLYLSDALMVSSQAWQFRIVDAGTGSTNYVVEYRPDLSPTNGWTSPTNVTTRGGGVFEVATGPPQRDTGFYRVKGLRLLRAGFSSSEYTAEEGAGAAGAVIVFNGPFSGLLSYAWRDEQGTTWTNQIQVNGTTAVIPAPTTDDSTIGRLSHLTLRLEAGANYGRSGTLESRVTIEENDAEWVGTLQTANGTLGFELTLLRTNGCFQGEIKSGGSGFFPTNALAQVTFAEDSFTAVATNAPLPALPGSPLFSAPSYVDLRLDATNAPGQTNVSPTEVEGVATLVSRVPGRWYLDTGVSGTFRLLRTATAHSTNEVPLTPVP